MYICQTCSIHIKEVFIQKSHSAKGGMLSGNTLPRVADVILESVYAPFIELSFFIFKVSLYT